ncbi:Fungalysin metallopeptidase-domain-containing protein [Mycena epipterygia]|nr:Fungalysin metallopeptidase-domain-containing protein [Mycena epipterygia]
MANFDLNPSPNLQKSISVRVFELPNSLATYEVFLDSVRLWIITKCFQTYAEGLPCVADTSPSRGIESAAIAYATPALKEISKDSGLEYTSGYRKGNMTYAYVQQTHNDKTIGYSVANIAWKDNRVVAFGQSFVKFESAASNIAKIDITTAIPMAERHAVGAHNGHPPKMEYLLGPDSHLALVHVIQIQNDDEGTWHEAFIDAHSGQLLSLNDFVCHSTAILPISGDAVPPDGFETSTDPADTTASPSGWHTVGTSSTTTTAGNNGIACENRIQSSTTEQSSATLNFNYAFDASKDPTDTTNLNAARVNAFYVANTFHDFTYRYGFTEDAFNFQAYNFDRGGKEGDRVLMSVQDKTKNRKNNSSFHSPEDGQSGICRLFLWDKTDPERDSAFDRGILIHELTHGLTNRMTGGGTARALKTAEAAGLGEGWSDAMADWVSQTSAPIKDYPRAAYAAGNEKGRRMFQYSTSEDTNPLTYGSVSQYVEEVGKENVHCIGQIWANILHNIQAALVQKYGFSTSAMTNPEGPEGNIMFLHLFIDALALQPAQPTFLFARQAFLQADANRYNGANQALLWNVFASRGLGVDATADYEESPLVPSHSKVIIVERPQTKLPPLKGGWDGGVAYDGCIASVSVNPGTVVTIFGVAPFSRSVQMICLTCISSRS